MYTTLTSLFKGICDAVRSVIGSTNNINHQEIPNTINGIAEEIKIQEELIAEISSALSEKASAYPIVIFDEDTGTLTITEGTK